MTSTIETNTWYCPYFFLSRDFINLTAKNPETNWEWIRETRLSREFTKSRVNSPKIASLPARFKNRTVDHWNVHPPDRRTCTSSCFVRGHKVDSRYDATVLPVRSYADGGWLSAALEIEDSPTPFPREDSRRRTRVREILFPLSRLSRSK